MDLFVLNNALQADTLVDGYLNFVWTERYSSDSDFHIELPNTAYFRKLLSIDTILMISESNQPQIIETFYVKKQQDGSVRYIVEGRDLTSWLELRQAGFDVSYTGTRVSQIAVNLLNVGAINPNDPKDDIPGMGLSNQSTDGAVFDFETGNDNLLTDVRNILNDNNCAIRCTRISSGGSYSLRYEIYNGLSKNVVFSDRDDTLLNTQRVSSKKKFRNRAEVRYKESNKETARTLVRIVYANGGNANQSGLDRATIRVDATSVNPADYPGSRFGVLLDRMGRAALAKQRFLSAVDGEVPSYSTFKYGTHYKLGDIVKFKSDDNVPSDARVTEYIWTEDENGQRAYPTIDPVVSQTV